MAKQAVEAQLKRSVPRARKGSGSRSPKVEVAKLGRRPGQNDTREMILDAAEMLFSAHGHAATSLRQISAKAGVNQSLVSHYFGSKDGLYQAVFLRRGAQLANARLALLDRLEQGGDVPSLEDLVRAYLRPAFDLKRTGAGGLAFLNLQARLYAEPPAMAQSLRATLYDLAMQRYIAAIRRTMPDLSPETVYWRMVFAVGAYLYTIADLHRIGSLSGGQCDPSDLDKSFDQIVTFLVGGLSAKGKRVTAKPAPAHKSPRPSSRARVTRP